MFFGLGKNLGIGYFQKISGQFGLVSVRFRFPDNLYKNVGYYGVLRMKILDNSKNVILFLIKSIRVVRVLVILFINNIFRVFDYFKTKYN